MLVGGVIRDHVDDDFQAQAVSMGHERVEIGERAEHGIDVAVVGDVIARVVLRRGEKG